MFFDLFMWRTLLNILKLFLCLLWVVINQMQTIIEVNMIVNAEIIGQVSYSLGFFQIG